MGEPPRRGLWNWLRQLIHETFVEPLVNSRHPPWFDARGVALGFIIGFGVPVGGQVITLGILRVFVRFNFIVALAFTLVSNPFDMVPLYYVYYLLGTAVVGQPLAVGFEGFSKLLSPIVDKDYFWESLSEFLRLGKDFLVRWCVAAAIISSVFGAIGYAVTYAVQKARCKRTAEKLGVQYEKFLAELETKSVKSRPEAR
jgi:uncharacterized protein (DUF2062 family)